jgi:hypothetical protein
VPARTVAGASEVATVHEYGGLADAARSTEIVVPNRTLMLSPLLDAPTSTLGGGASGTAARGGVGTSVVTAPMVGKKLDAALADGDTAA